MILGLKTKSIWIPVFTGMTIGVAIFAFGAKTADASGLVKAPNNLGLVGYWSFADATGTIATDFSGKQRTGSLTNMETADWVQGKRGTGLVFDGSNEYVSVNPTLPLPGTGDFSWALWLKTSTSSNLALLNFGQGGSNRDNISLTINGTGGSFLACGAANKLSFLVHDAAPTDYCATSTSTVTDGQWHHAVGVRSGNVNYLYVDGNLESSVTGLSGIDISPMGSNFDIAAVVTTSAMYFDGSLDEIRVYDRALSATEALALYGSGAARIKAPTNLGLKAYWSFDDATGTIASDLSGNSNEATLTVSSTAPLWVSGKHGTALSFATSTGVVTVADTARLDLTVSTVAFWVKTTAGGYIFYKQGQFGDIINTSNGNLQLVSSNGGEGLDTGAFIADGKWHHVAVANTTGATNGTFAYVDGVLVGTTVITITNQTADLYIGASDSSHNSTWTGMMDDIRIYNRILSAAEVDALYRSNAVRSNASQNSKLTSGLVGLWSFDGADLRATTAYDRSGTGNHGTLTGGPVPAIGKIGQALRFDGTNDYVSVADHNSLDLTDLTISFWFKPNVTLNAATGRKDFLVKYLSYWIIFNYPGNDGKLILTTNSGGNSIRTTVTSWEADTWYYFVATLNASSDAKIYINGVEDISGVVSTPSVTAAAVEIGGSAGAGSYPNITMDEVRLYNRVLTAAEVLQLYNMGK